MCGKAEDSVNHAASYPTSNIKDDKIGLEQRTLKNM